MSAVEGNVMVTRNPSLLQSLRLVTANASSGGTDP